MDVRTNRQLAPRFAHPFSGSVPPLQPALQRHNQSVARLRFQLAGVLDKANIPRTLHSSIFDHAQLWFCFGVERQLTCEGRDMNLMYQTFDPHEANTLCEAGTLRVVRVAGVSHDQGWASSDYENRNTTTDSWTWVDMALTSDEQVVVEPVRAYTNWQANRTFAYYEEDFNHDTQLVQSWTPGSKIEQGCAPCSQAGA